MRESAFGEPDELALAVAVALGLEKFMSAILTHLGSNVTKLTSLTKF
jgi:hypothetical protein